MKVEIYKWDTIHNQGEKTMTHIFDNKIKCVVDWAEQTLSIVYREEIIDIFLFGDYTIKAHEELMIEISKIAQKRYIIDFKNARRKKLLRNIRNNMPRVKNP